MTVGETSPHKTVGDTSPTPDQVERGGWFTDACPPNLRVSEQRGVVEDYIALSEGGDVTQEFFKLTSTEFKSFCLALKEKGYELTLCFSLPVNLESGKIIELLRRVKALLEMRRIDSVFIIATEEQAKFEPNVFSSGVVRIDPSVVY